MKRAGFFWISVLYATPAAFPRIAASAFRIVPSGDLATGCFFIIGLFAAPPSCGMSVKVRIASIQYLQPGESRRLGMRYLRPDSAHRCLVPSAMATGFRACAISPRADPLSTRSD